MAELSGYDSRPRGLLQHRERERSLSPQGPPRDERRRGRVIQPEELKDAEPE